MIQAEWIRCPVCNNKTRDRIREDTVLINHPLYCPKCKQECLIEAKDLNKNAFCIVGKSCPLSRELGENFMTIPHEWDSALENGTLSKLYSLMDGEPSGLLGVSVHNTEEWKYFIAVCSTKKDEFFESYEIPAATWAIFSGEGTNISLQDLERRVITEWLPASGYEYAEIPDVEVYIKADPQDAIYEYWLPVVKKQEDE